MPNFTELDMAKLWFATNIRVFGGALRVQPSFMFFDSTKTLGEWNPQSRMMRFSRQFVMTASRFEIVEVLKHEMAHQYVSDVLGVTDETSHGPAFRMVCKRHGIDARASSSGLSAAAQSKIDTIQKLLRLGESDNPNEAKVALKQAQALMRRYGLDEFAVGDGGEETLGAIRLGSSFKRIPAYAKALGGVLVEHFSVRGIWISHDNGSQLELVGEHGQLEISAHVHDYLLAEAERLWARRGEHSKRAKDDFFEGIIIEVSKSLGVAKLEANEPGLVVHDEARIAEVTAFYKARYPQTGTVGGSRKRRGKAFGDGREAGRDVKIRPPVKAGSPKLLAGKSGT